LKFHHKKSLLRSKKLSGKMHVKMKQDEVYDENPTNVIYR